MNGKIVKHGPVVKYSGMLPQRLVVRELHGGKGEVVEFVVHTQGFTESGSAFSNGSYFPVRCYATLEEAKAKAEERYEERLGTLLSGAKAENYQHPDAIDVLMRLISDSQMGRVI